MDDKTLEYMKERVEKALDIKNQILSLKNFLDRLDAGDQMEIEVKDKKYSDRHHLSNVISKDDIYGMFAALVRASIYKLIQEYQKELDEI